MVFVDNAPCVGLNLNSRNVPKIQPSKSLRLPQLQPISLLSIGMNILDEFHDFVGWASLGKIVDTNFRSFLAFFKCLAKLKINSSEDSD